MADNKKISEAPSYGYFESLAIRTGRSLDALMEHEQENRYLATRPGPNNTEIQFLCENPALITWRMTKIPMGDPIPRLIPIEISEMPQSETKHKHRKRSTWQERGQGEEI